jgi:ABC-2 type transport system ATP-binding protein
VRRLARPEEADTEAAVEATDLTKRYGRVLALAGLTMRVERGEVFGFLGPNGAGKTTAVKLLLGLARPTGGRASVLGAALGARGVRARIGYLPELFRYQGWLTGREVVALHGELSGVAERRVDRLAAAERALRTVDLLDRADDRVATYSKGMQQRLGLAVALLGRPELVILDEPTSALDPLGRADVRDLVRTLSADGVTVFLNSHLLGEVEQVCDRVAIVDRGRVIAAGPPSDLLGDAVLLVRATGLDLPSVRAVSERHRLRVADGALTGHVAPAAVPELIAALVAAGAGIHGVEQRRRSLEEAFRDLVAESGVARTAA